MKCCKSNNVKQYKCGTNQDGVLQVVNDINKFGGYLSDFLLTKCKTILVTFDRPEYDEPGPGEPPGSLPNDFPANFEGVNLEKTKERIKYIVDISGADQEYKIPGSINEAFEKKCDDTYSLIYKIILCFKEIIQYTSLNIIFCNTGLPENIESISNDIRLTETEININIIDPNIELVIVVDPNKKTELDAINAGGMASHIGKLPNLYISIDPKFPLGNIQQNIFINEKTNKITYIEKKESEEPGEPSYETIINLEFAPTFKYCNPGNLNEFKNTINSQINTAFENHPETNKFFYKIQLNFYIDNGGGLGTNPSYNFNFYLIINENGQDGLNSPYRCEIKNNSIYKSFGISNNEPLILENPEINDSFITLKIDTLYHNVVYLGNSFSFNIFHEFCHVLGMIHEFSRDIPTNKYKDDVWAPGSIHRIITYRNNISDFDFDSVMMYWFKRCEFITEKVQQSPELINTRFNNWLSNEDKKTLTLMYPPVVNNNNNNNNHNNNTRRMVENYKYKKNKKGKMINIIIIVFSLLIIFLLFFLILN